MLFSFEQHQEAAGGLYLWFHGSCFGATDGAVWIRTSIFTRCTAELVMHSQGLPRDDMGYGISSYCMLRMCQ